MIPSESRPARRSDLRLALLAFAQLIATVDINIVFVALPDIGRRLGFTADSLQWVVSAYVLGLGGFLLLGGRAVDRFGPRRMFSLALSLYAVSSLAGGLAQDQGLLVGARFVQGLGGALVTPATLKLIYLTFTDPRERTRAVGVWGAAGGAGLSVGALLGGLLTDYLGWSWVFFVNVPLALLAAVCAPRLLDADPPATAGGGFDVAGAVIATAGLSSIVFGLVSGPISGWGSVRAAGALILGAVLLAAFAALEARVEDPLVPLRMFGNRHLRTVMIVIFFFQGGLSFTYYLFTTYLQVGLSFSALGAGLSFLPPTVVSMISALRLNPWLVGRYGVRGALCGGTVLVAAGLAGITASLSAGGSSWTMLPGAVVWGLGGGAAFPALFVAAGQGVAPGEQGVAAGLVSTFRQVGGAVGLAVLIAVATADLAVGTAAHPAAGSVIAGLRTSGWVATGLTLFAALLALRLREPAPAAVPVPAKSAASA